jgi:hypothetical protein
VVDWGDNTTSTVTSASDPNKNHTYAAIGTYIVTIDGLCEGWSFLEYSISATKFKKVIDWGTNKFKYLKGAFYNCNLLELPLNQSILGDIDDLSYIFYNCSELISIPDGLFDNNPFVTNFSHAFDSCNSISSIPDGLFDNNPLVTNFSYIFINVQLSSIPDGLFDNNPLVTNFSYAFDGCVQLLTIPDGLFDNNTLVTDFSFTFYNCVQISTIPDGLFRYNTVATNFDSCFRSCPKLQLHTTIFYAAGERDTRFFNKSVRFVNCFQRTSFAGVQGVAPDIWLCNWGTGTPIISTSTSNRPFDGPGNSLTSLSNYDSIPAIWKLRRK